MDAYKNYPSLIEIKRKDDEFAETIQRISKSTDYNDFEDIIYGGLYLLSQ